MVHKRILISMSFVLVALVTCHGASFGKTTFPTSVAARMYTEKPDAFESLYNFLIDKNIAGALTLINDNENANVLRDNINQQDESGNTILHYAAQLGNWRIIEMLMRLGAEPNISNNDNVTPRGIALNAGHVAVSQDMPILARQLAPLFQNIEGFLGRTLPVTHQVLPQQEQQEGLHSAAQVGQFQNDLELALNLSADDPRREEILRRLLPGTTLLFD